MRCEFTYGIIKPNITNVSILFFCYSSRQIRTLTSLTDIQTTSGPGRENLKDSKLTARDAPMSGVPTSVSWTNDRGIPNVLS